MSGDSRDDTDALPEVFTPLTHGLLRGARLPNAGERDRSNGLSQARSNLLSGPGSPRYHSWYIPSFLPGLRLAAVRGHRPRASGRGTAKAALGAMREERGHYCEEGRRVLQGEGTRPPLVATVRHAQGQRICHQCLPARRLAERVVSPPPKVLGLGTSRPSFAPRSGGIGRRLPSPRRPHLRSRRTPSRPCRRGAQSLAGEDETIG